MVVLRVTTVVLRVTKTKDGPRPQGSKVGNAGEKW